MNDFDKPNSFEDFLQSIDLASPALDREELMFQCGHASALANERNSTNSSARVLPFKPLYSVAALVTVFLVGLFSSGWLLDAVGIGTRGDERYSDGRYSDGRYSDGRLGDDRLGDGESVAIQEDGNDSDLRMHAARSPLFERLLERPLPVRSQMYATSHRLDHGIDLQPASASAEDIESDSVPVGRIIRAGEFAGLLSSDDL